MYERIREKLGILADAAKYDVSCSSSGSNRKNENKGIGDAEGTGICHLHRRRKVCVATENTAYQPLHLLAHFAYRGAAMISNALHSLWKKW